ncbi:hypothetical protein DFH28DRAFT_984399 [Melampsora americana]|nr:hypothetical protein DFH28DRAFT_984399 [Melampsora americana]
MGAMCGKSQHFEGEGYQLNPLSSTKPSHQSNQPKPTNFPTTSNSTRSPDPERREALAKAAEARVIASKTRGGNGNLSKALAQQKSDGGRTKEAIEIGSGNSKSSKPLVWD